MAAPSDPARPARLILDGEALSANWRWLSARSGGAACGAAVKADGYGLGAIEVVRRLVRAGCRHFFVATWAEAGEIAPHLGGARLSVLHGVREADMAAARRLPAVPVLNSSAQVARWRESGGGACDVMIDTGMNRLGLPAASQALLDGLGIETVMSHLACADEDHAMNEGQRRAFVAATADIRAERRSLANSAAILLGSDYAFDLTRPGLALYGGVPRDEATGRIAQVAVPEADILQRRIVRAGETVGYGATWTAPCDTEVAILNIGYADGYPRGLSGRGEALADDGTVLPLIGRVSMDLIAVDVTARPALGEGDRLRLAFDLRRVAAAAGLSQYELLTNLGARFERCWG